MTTTGPKAPSCSALRPAINTVLTSARCLRRPSTRPFARLHLAAGALARRLGERRTGARRTRLQERGHRVVASSCLTAAFRLHGPASAEAVGRSLAEDTFSGGEEEERRRRLRQTRELARGSGAPRSVVRALLPGVHPRPARRRRWKTGGRAEKYALVQTQVIT